MKKILLSLLVLCGLLFSQNANAQRAENEVVVSAGLGYSLSMALLKGSINLGLRESGLNEIKAIPIINGMVDYGITENFSVGGAYSFHQWNWQDEYTDSVGVTTAGNVNIARHNVGARGLFHFGSNEKVDMYAGARVGYSLWRLKADAANTEGESASEFRAPGGIFTAQALFGARAYFNSVIGANVEIGLGTAPYFIQGGLSFRLNGNR